MVKQLLALLLCIAYSFTTTAQQTIKGIVIDASTNQPIEGASVTLSPTNKLVITDATGKFTFKGHYPQDASITVTYIGYASQKTCRMSQFPTK